MKATALKVVNVILALVFLNQAATGLLRDSLSREAFVILHQNAGIVLVACVVVHVVLNWNWVRSALLKRRAAKG